MYDFASCLLARLQELGTITDTSGSLTRTFLSPGMEQAGAKVGEWMKEQGGEVTRDGWGNLIGHFAGSSPGGRTLLLGSHLDTVPNAGLYDGPLGVLTALAALDELTGRGVRLPFDVDVLGFSDEEGTRFHSAYLGSKALAGLVQPEDLLLRDMNGITLGDAVARYQGAEAVSLPAPRYDPRRLLGYVEVHIEQGPVLQEKQLPLGVVDAIAAQSRFVITVRGRAGHAGTTPMPLRHDALTGAAEMVGRIEQVGREVAGLVATVGQFSVRPGASNVIPDHVRFSLDIRHPDRGALDAARSRLERETGVIADARGLTVERETVQTSDGVKCASHLIAGLEKAVAAQQSAVPRMISGAGHDGVVLSRITPVGMLFVRCRDGVSHHPDEHVELEDIAAACRALAHFLESLS